MPDFRAFLKPQAPVVLPYFGGTRVDAADRRYQVDGALAPGWWRFAIAGRRAVPQAPAAAIELASLPAMRGHWIDGHIIVSGRELARVGIPPDEEPAPLARVVGRRWYSGDVLLDAIEFEDDAELAARAALEDRRGIADVKGIVPSLRVAYAIGLGIAVARELGVPVSPRELAPSVVAIADGGASAASAAIVAIAARRAQAAASRERAAIRDVVDRAHRQRRGTTPAERADEALAAAGARMLAARRVGAALEVTFSYETVRIIATVDPDTLHVFDAGICLDGEDEQLTLDSLPSVIKEAIAHDQLNITRHA